MAPEYCGVTAKCRVSGRTGPNAPRRHHGQWTGEHTTTRQPNRAPGRSRRHLREASASLYTVDTSAIVTAGDVRAGVALLFFGWAMPMVGLTFALIERGVEQWWILLAFGLLMPVIAVFTVSVALSTRLRYLGGHPAPETAQATTHSASIEPDSASSTSRTGTVPVEPLSPREQDVLVLLESGRSNREIATMLYIAPGTVKAHLSHIFRKLQATTRLQAVNHAREAGILDTPDRE